MCILQGKRTISFQGRSIDCVSYIESIKKLPRFKFDLNQRLMGHIHQSCNEFYYISFALFCKK